MVSNLELPDPSPTADVWGEDLNDAIIAVNADVETNKVQIAANAALLAGKADASAVTAALANKADTSVVNAEFSAINTALLGKAESSDLDALSEVVSQKADTSVVNAELSSINAALLDKADSSTLDALTVTVGEKANTTYVDSEIASVDAVLAEKADLADVPVAPLFLKESELIPVGTKAETVVYRSQDYPQDVKVTHVSNNESTPISNFELPDDLVVGDVVLAIAVTMGAGRSYTWAAPWTEIFDYSQNRTTSAAIYRIVDDAALQAIEVPVITPSGNFDSMVLVTMKIEAQNAAWPAYSSGGGRSAATIVSPTNTGFSINTINTSPFASFDTEYVFAAAYGILSGPAPVITLPGTFEILVNATTGGLAFVIGKRAVSALPVAAVAVGVAHPASANALYGGAQFIVPAKEA